MEHAPISRRISWSCIGAIDVAPSWALGMPPPLETHFVPVNHVCKHLCAIRGTMIRPIQGASNYLLLPYPRDNGKLAKLMVPWTILMYPGIVAWNDFRCSDIVSPGWNKVATSTDVSNYYMWLYRHLAWTLWPDL